MKAPPNFEEYEPKGIVAILDTPKVARYVYWSIIKNRKFQDARRETWFTDFSESHLTVKYWSKLHLHINSITECTKLRFFQYKLLNKYIITNVRRNKMDKNVSAKCGFCGLVNETIKHLYADCSIVKKFLFSVKKWLKYIVKIDLPLDYQTLIMNKSTGPERQIIDTLAKQFIYAQKCLNKSLTVQQFIVHIVKYKNIEHVVASRKGRKAVEQFNRKWFDFVSARL